MRTVNRGAPFEDRGQPKMAFSGKRSFHMILVYWRAGRQRVFRDDWNGKGCL